MIITTSNSNITLTENYIHIEYINFFVTIILAAIGIILHICGLALLWKARKTTLDKTQRLILTNLSASELLLCILLIINTVLHETVEEDLNKSIFHVQSVINISTNYWFYLLMHALTADRLMQIFLSIRYPIYWSVKRTRVTLVLFWIIAIAGGIIVNQFVSERKTMAVYLCLNGTFLMISFLTYGYAIVITCQTQKRDKKLGSNIPVKRPRKKLFKGFTMIFCFIFSFIMFVLIPDSVYAYYDFKSVDSDITQKMELFVNIFYGLLYISDPLLYVFLCPQIRQIIKKKLKKNSLLHIATPNITSHE